MAVFCYIICTKSFTAQEVPLGQRPGERSVDETAALKGRDRLPPVRGFALSGLANLCVPRHPGLRPNGTSWAVNDLVQMI